MADNKPGAAAAPSHGALGGPKSADTKREGKVDDAQNQGGADQYLTDVRGTVFGDNTSSSGGANNPGQHGRDGGEIDGQTNNPTPSDAAIAGESTAVDTEDSQSIVDASKDAQPGIKKL